MSLAAKMAVTQTSIPGDALFSQDLTGSRQPSRDSSCKNGSLPLFQEPAFSGKMMSIRSSCMALVPMWRQTAKGQSTLGAEGKKYKSKLGASGILRLDTGPWP